MAVKFPMTNFREIPNKVVQFNDWSGGVNEVNDKDGLQPNESSVISGGFTNRYQGKLTLVNARDEFADSAANTGFVNLLDFKIIYADGQGYILILQDGGTYSYLRVISTDAANFDVVSGDWTTLVTIEANFTSWDLTVTTSEGQSVIYFVYETDEDPVVRKFYKISYKKKTDAYPYVHLETVIDIGGGGSTPYFGLKDSETRIWEMHDHTGSSYIASGSGGLNTQLVVGDVIVLALPEQDGHTYITSDSSIHIARVVDVTSNDVEIDHKIYDGTGSSDSFDIGALRVYIVTPKWAGDEHEDGSADLGWYARIQEIDKPYATMQNMVQFNLSEQLNSTTYDEAWATYFDPGDRLQYGFSYLYEGNQHGPLTKIDKNIEGKKDSIFRIALQIESELWASAVYTPSGDDFWGEVHNATASLRKREVKGLNIWRRKNDEVEWGLITYIPRTYESVVTDFEDLLVSGLAFWIRGVNSFTDVLLLMEPFKQTYEDDTDTYTGMLLRLATDDAVPLVDTFRGISGIDSDEAGNGIYGSTLCAIGERVFVGNTRYPIGHPIDPEVQYDDSVFYSAVQSGFTFPALNTLSFKSGESDELLKILISGTDLFMFKRHSLVVVNVAGVNEFAWTPRGTFPTGILHKDLAIKTPAGVVWFSDDAMYIFGKNGPQRLTDKIRDTYLANIGTPADNAIGWDPEFGRILATFDTTWSLGLMGEDKGWTQLPDTYKILDIAPDGKAVGWITGTADIQYIESASTAGNYGTYTWQSGQRSLGPMGQKKRIKRVYVNYLYNRQWTSGDSALATLTWYIDGVEAGNDTLDLGTASDQGGEAVQRIRVNGKGRFVEFKLVLYGVGSDFIDQFELKNIEIVYREKKLK